MGTSYKLILLFANKKLGGRGKHWLSHNHINVPYYRITEEDDVHDWIFSRLDTVDPDIIMIGGLRNSYSKSTINWAASKKRKIVFFGEIPGDTSPLANFIRKIWYSFFFRYYSIENYLVCGTRAVDYYRSLAPARSLVFNFHYYQRFPKLEELDNNRDKVTFLFSGQLIDRNSIIQIINSFKSIYLAGERNFKFIVSGYGVREGDLIDIINSAPGLNEHIEFSRDFESWDERLDPFLRSDILMSPARHSGWGLTVMEALNIGLFVVSTYGVEAARNYIIPFHNGMFINSDEQSIVRSIQFCIRNINCIRSSKRSRIVSLNAGSVDLGVRNLAGILDYTSGFEEV